MKYVYYAALIMVVGWIAYRAVWLVGKILRRGTGPEPRVDYQCPKCGSDQLDDESDADSGYCLSCKHIWGVGPPEDEAQKGDREGA